MKSQMGLSKKTFQSPTYALECLSTQIIAEIPAWVAADMPLLSSVCRRLGTFASSTSSQQLADMTNFTLRYSALQRNGISPSLVLRQSRLSDILPITYNK